MSIRSAVCRVSVPVACAVLAGCAQVPVPGASTPAMDRPDVPPALAAITEGDLRRDLFTLAGDEMRGREAGTMDEMRATMWLVERAREIGLEPAGDDGTYLQFFPVARVTQSEESAVRVGTATLRFGSDFVTTARTSAVVEGPIVVVADGSPADSATMAGKVVVARLTPAEGAALADIQPRRGPGPLEAEQVRFQRLVTTRSAALRDAGARAILLVADSSLERHFLAVSGAAIRGQYLRDSAAAGGGRGGRGGQGGGAQAPTLVFRHAALAGLSAPGETARITLSLDRFVYPSANIVAQIPGTDPRLRGQYVLYSAHQDHDGVRHVVDGDSIWNGADDNATVSVALLAIGRALKARPTARTSLFVWHGAEERGLHGSYWYAARPTVARDSIVAVLNGDMIGRNHPDTAALLGVQPPNRNSSVLATMALDANQRIIGFAIDSTWDRPTHREGWWRRSDHLPYALSGIPAIFFSTLLHSDYHTPNDEPDRIDIVKLRRMTQWMYATGWAVGNSARRPPLDSATPGR